MLRDVAVARIQDGLGFANRQTDKIILRLQEAQRELEKGKTLPRFLLQESQVLVLNAGDYTVALPTGFLRMQDSAPLHFQVNSLATSSFLRVTTDYKLALEASTATADEDANGPGRPSIALLRATTINFLVQADQEYRFIWDYYKAADILDSNIENAWLQNAPEWLIGEAGWRMAMDVRDKDAVVVFDNLRKTGRAAIFGEIIAYEDSTGPLVMGANL